VSTDANCLFCKIISRAVAGTIVHQDERITAIRDINPAAPIHILLLPNRHIDSTAAAAAEDEGLLGALLLAGADLARQEGIEQDGYRLVINTGSNAGQSVQHLHVHLLGGRQMHWPPG
jgi:histidine triad (HIT) family protein